MVEQLSEKEEELKLDELRTYVEGAGNTIRLGDINRMSHAGRRKCYTLMKIMIEYYNGIREGVDLTRYVKTYSIVKGLTVGETDEDKD